MRASDFVQLYISAKCGVHKFLLRTISGALTSCTVLMIASLVCARKREKTEISKKLLKTTTWANSQHDGRPVEYRWRPLFNTAKFG